MPLTRTYYRKKKKEVNTYYITDTPGVCSYFSSKALFMGTNCPHFVMIKGEKMKRLKKEELGGIDSTSKTIKKWDTFFKEALPRLGYRQDLIDNMYPYQNGIPMMDGTYMPVDETTGRAFFKMSAADKLCCVLSTINKQGYGATNPTEYIKKVLRQWWEEDANFFSACFPDEESLPGSKFTASHWDELFKKFIMDSEVALSTNGQQAVVPQGEATLSDENKERLFRLTHDAAQLGDFHTGNFFIRLYNKTLANNYDYKFSRERIRSIFESNVPMSCLNKLRSFDEVYLQEYLVVSLNPIDKFMCSTKQAFGSCMSIAKQLDCNGTSSVYAFGLPVLFPTDSAFLVFMTAGKHKNMYWESSEWQKDASKRDPEKAYKYIKMTCRALTYKGAPSVNDYNEISSLISDKEKEGKLFTQERLYIGRQYSANGEDFAWQSVISYLLGKAGVSTSYAYADQLEKVDDFISNGRENPFFEARKYLNKGLMPQKKAPVAIDKYGFVRSIYYDNLRYTITPDRDIRRVFDGYCGYDHPLNSETTIEDIQSEIPVYIQVGSSRSGSGGMVPVWPKAGLDMFQIMTGKQPITYFNQHLKICAECGELIKEICGTIKDSEGTERHICTSCMQKLHYVKCESCGYLYKEDDEEARAEHRIINIQEALHPDDFDKFPPIKICRSKICSIVTKGNKVVCLHCGEIVDSWKVSSYMQSTVTVGGFRFPVGICEECTRNAVVCSKCKKIVFLDDVADAVLLLPKRRIICPSCIESIRLTQKKRKLYQELLDTGLTKEDIKAGRIDTSDWTEEQKIAYKALQQDRDILLKTTVKDVDRQIRSYQIAHTNSTILDQVR